VQGWVVSLQHLKNKSFAMLNDGTTHERIQAVLSPAQAAKYVFLLLNTGLTSRLSYRTSVSIQGKLVAPRRPESAQQRYDIQVDSLDVIGHSLTV
jgi:aspartyl/asparaginyl-tRNA synthetase